MRSHWKIALVVGCVALFGGSRLLAQATTKVAPKTTTTTQATTDKKPEKAVDPLADIPIPDTPPLPKDSTEPIVDKPSADIPGLTRLDKVGDVWIDGKRKIVVVDGRVVMREGTLEMFACSKATKEHESVVSVTAKPSVIHTGLLAVGAKSGTVVKWEPEYKPATGSTIEIIVLWKDKDGKPHKARAQDFVRHRKTKKAMEYEWVFPGSGFWRDDETGKMHYHADSGDFICVSNFPTATLDIPVKSSQDDMNLEFEAFTENIPAKGTKVRLVLIPKPEKDEKKDAEKPVEKPVEKTPATIKK